MPLLFFAIRLRRIRHSKSLRLDVLNNAFFYQILLVVLIIIGSSSSSSNHILIRLLIELDTQVVYQGKNMKNSLDSKMLLRVFEKARQHGEERDGAFHLNGIKAYSDLDGYTLYLEDALVKLSYGFHNKYHFDYEKHSEFESFEKKLESIDKEY